jgi:plasmid stability protein
MAQIIIRNLDDAVVKALKAEAVQNGRSMEAEVRSRLEESFEDKKHKESKRELMERFRRHRERIRLPKGVTTTQILREIRDES